MMSPIIRSIDHIMVRVAEAESLFTLFTRTLGLPVSWPLQQSDFATFGWVSIGNTNLEFWAAADNSDLPSNIQLPTFHGFALEPSKLSESVATLSESGITCKNPRPFITKKSDGREAVNFTNSVILDVTTDTCCVFFCEWHPDGTIFPWDERLTTLERRKREKAKLLECGGGQLGITGLIEIQIQMPLPNKALPAWEVITGQRGQLLTLTDGVQLRILPGPEYKVDALVLGVRSLQQTRNFLVENALLDQETASELTLSKEVAGGLTFRFKQSFL